MPKSITPSFKLIGLVSPLSDMELVNLITKCNGFIKPNTLSIIRRYSPTRLYGNILYNCDLDTIKEIQHRGCLFIGLNDYRCFEQIDLIQCFNCQQYGNFQNECKSPVCCKNCAGAHHFKNCDHQNANKCSN